MKIHWQATSGYLPVTVQRLCDLQDAISVLTKRFPLYPLPREAEDFPRSGNHSKHISLLNS